MVPQPGDVLVSNPTATVAHDISIVPEPPQLTYANLHRAVAKARELAEQLQVDAWLSEDHIHFLCIASCRKRANAENSASLDAAARVYCANGPHRQLVHE